MNETAEINRNVIMLALCSGDKNEHQSTFIMVNASQARVEAQRCILVSLADLKKLLFDHLPLSQKPVGSPSIISLTFSCQRSSTPTLRLRVLWRGSARLKARG